MKRNGIFISARSLIDSVPLMDMHIHTVYSDGTSAVSEYVKEAERRGFGRICFTDHVNPATSWYMDYADEIESKRRSQTHMDILHGIEVRAGDREGTLNAADAVIDRAEMVIGVVHSIPSKDGRDKRSAREYPREELLELEYAISLRLLHNESVSVLGHPMSNYEKLYGPVPSKYYRGIISESKAQGKAVEISAKHLNDIEGFLRLCLELDPMVSLGSDAHSLGEFGKISGKVDSAIKSICCNDKKESLPLRAR